MLPLVALTFDVPVTASNTKLAWDGQLLRDSRKGDVCPCEKKGRWSATEDSSVGPGHAEFDVSQGSLSSEGRKGDSKIGNDTLDQGSNRQRERHRERDRFDKRKIIGACRAGRGDLRAFT